MNYSFAEYVPQIISEQAPPAKRSWAWLAWLIICALSGFMILARQVGGTQKAGPVDESLGSILMEIQARYLLGATDFLKQGKQDFLQQAGALNQGAIEDRLRFIVLAGELSDAAKANELLQDLDKLVAVRNVTLSTEQSRCRALLGRLYHHYQHGQLTAPSLNADDRDFLRRTLGWFGDLALAPAGLVLAEDQITAAAGGLVGLATAELHPPNPAGRQAVLDSAQKTFGIIIASVLGGFLLGVAGFIGLLLFVVLAFSGWVQFHFKECVSHGPIYAETFAVWLVLFIGLQIPLQLVRGPSIDLLLQAVVMLGSLLALLWPVWRGIPWRQVRQDLGLTLGRRPMAEVGFGLVSYILALPLVGAGLVVTVSLLLFARTVSEGADDPFVSPSMPAHPVVEAMSRADWRTLLQLFFLASVVAPLVEEIMFRGVLYCHLRDASTRYGWFLSSFFSATLVSFIFAVLHPQGLLAVPLLMGLAYGFALAREWRGTLLPSMVGHGVSNALVTLVAFLALGG